MLKSAISKKIKGSLLSSGEIKCVEKSAAIFMKGFQECVGDIGFPLFLCFFFSMRKKVKEVH